MRRHAIFGILLTTILVLMPALRAQDGLDGALSLGQSHLLDRFGQRLIAADFDQDHKPDGAVLVETGSTHGLRSFRIELHVTAGNNETLTFTDTEAELSIIALDVNQDGAPDIVVERAFTHQPLQIWLNNGHGAFEKVQTEDFFRSDPSSNGWRRLPGQNYLGLFIPTKSGSDGSVQELAETSIQDHCLGRDFHSQDRPARFDPRALNPSRAPPSFHSL